MYAGGGIVPVRLLDTRQQKGDFEGCDRTFRIAQFMFQMLRNETIVEQNESTTHGVRIEPGATPLSAQGGIWQGPC